MWTIGEHWEGMGRPVFFFFYFTDKGIFLVEIMEGQLSLPPSCQSVMNLARDWLSMGLRTGPVGIRGERGEEQRFD